MTLNNAKMATSQRVSETADIDADALGSGGNTSSSNEVVFNVKSDSCRNMSCDNASFNLSVVGASLSIVGLAVCVGYEVGVLVGIAEGDFVGSFVG